MFLEANGERNWRPKRDTSWPDADACPRLLFEASTSLAATIDSARPLNFNNLSTEIINMHTNQLGIEPGLPIRARPPLATRQTPATPLPIYPPKVDASGDLSRASHNSNVKRGDGSVRRLVLTALANPDIARWSNAEIARILSVSASSVDRQRHSQPDLRPRLPATGLQRLCKRGSATLTLNVAGIGSMSHG